MQYCKDEFAEQYPVQISPDPENRYGKEYKSYPDTQADCTVYQTDPGSSQTIQHAGEGSIEIQKWTDKGHSADIRACSSAVE